MGKTSKRFNGVNLVKIKREDKSSLFAPNLTMNLTYLCSGYVNVDEWVRHRTIKRLNTLFSDKGNFPESHLYR